MFTVVAMAQQKKYVSYPVKKGETMKKIAKRLDISTRTLLKLNPGIKRRPTPNTIIIIPNKNFGLVVDNKNISQNTYVVKAKETWYGIAKKHSVSIAALKAKNPTINELAIGAELQIPVVEITTLNVEEKYQLHTVVKDDTIYNLTKLYGLSKTELLQMNPALKEGLKLGMVLKIRVLNVENIPENLPLFEENLDFEKTINIALMLPYNLYKLTDSIRNKSFEKPTSLLNIATDFHLGTSMAIDSLRAKGLEINVQYFDTENSKEKLQYLVNTHNFNAYDAVIGPLYFDKAYWVSNQINTPVIAPVYSKTQTSISADNLIKSAPKAQVFEEKLLSYIERNYKGENIVIINDEKPTSQIKLQRVLARLNKFNTQKNISVVIPENDYIERDTLMPRVKDSIHNTVLLITNDVVTTAAAVNYLKLFMADHDIVFYAFNKGKRLGIEYIPIVNGGQGNELVGILNANAAHRKLSAEVLAKQHEADSMYSLESADTETL